MVADVIDALPDCSHIVCYWSDESDLKPELEHRGVTLIRIPFYGMWSWPYTWFVFNRLVKRRGPRFIHSHMLVPNLLVRTLLNKNFLGIATYHGECLEGTNWKSRLTRWLERSTLHRTDKVVAVSDYVKGYLTEKLNTSSKIEVVHNFGRKGAPANLNPYLPLRLVATSNNHPYKNYSVLIEAMKQLANRPVRLDIYGHGMTTLESYVKRSGLTNISFLGVVNDVTQHFSKYNVFVIVSESGEGFSLALLEAMNSGLPVICSNIPQFIEAVGTEALLFEKNSMSDLVSKVNQLIDRPELLSQLSAGSISRTQMFSRSIFVNRIRTIYGRT